MRHRAGILAWVATAGAALLAGGLLAQEKGDPPAAKEDLRGALINRGEVPETKPEDYVALERPETVGLLDGTLIVHRRATVMPHEASGWTLVVFERDPSLPAEQPRWLLPNQLLEAVESIAAEKPKQVFRVSGETTVYRGQVYLLLRKVTVEAGGGAPKPAPVRAAPVRPEPVRPEPAPRVEPPAPEPVTPPVVKPAAPAKAPPAQRPAPRPMTRPATSRPAGPKRPSSDDILKGLLKDRPGIPVIPPTVPPEEGSEGDVPVERRTGAPPGPSPSPESPPATSRPAEGKRPGADEIRKGLLEDRPGKPVIPPVVPAGPKGGTDSVAPGADEDVLPPARGRLITDRVVRILPAGVGVWQEIRFEADNTLREPPVRLLPCLLLEDVVKGAAGGRTKFRISGELTHYRGRRYLLLRKALRVRDLGTF